MNDFYLRVMRGGSWFNLPVSCRSDFRIGRPARTTRSRIGFRVVCIPQPSISIMARIFRVLRGSSWDNCPVCCRSAYRQSLPPAYATKSIGFRVVCQPSPSPGFMSQILRLIRGGSWINAPVICRSAFRYYYPADADFHIGFRVVRIPQPTPGFMSRILRLVRGGSWFYKPQSCRSAYRVKIYPADSDVNVGFRLTSQEPPATDIAMVKIPAGSFLMGSPTSEESHFASELPQHEVTLGTFWMSQSPITQAQWEYVMGTNPSYFKGKDLPVECVSWHDAMEFCRRLSERTGDTYTLPSEAQWEYACRAGTTTPFSFGDTITTDQANYDGNYTYGNGPRGEYRQQTTPVGMFPPNDWGLHDMHGNVWEWCLDQWHPNYKGAPVDGSAWEGGDE